MTELQWVWIVTMRHDFRVLLVTDDFGTAEQVTYWLNHYDKSSQFYWWSDQAVLSK